ncbi:MAG: AMP-binding protein [Thermomicrobiales bacterium]|nr:AMP-binding protein [Thermomicrobiales bacterium]
MPNSSPDAAPARRVDPNAIAWTPTPEVIARSRLHRFVHSLGLDSTAQLQLRAAADPGWYWDAAVRDLGFVWSRPYTRALDRSAGPAWPHWFVDGEFNYAANALDRWVAAGSGERTALIWEGDDGATRTLSFAALLAETDRFAAALRGLGVRKGDRVGVFLPMLAETAIAMLALAKLGAIFLPMFSGFGPDAIAARLRDAEANLLICADGARRRGHTVPMKTTADAAVALAPSVARVVVLRRTGEPVPMTPGRDVWWHDLVAAAPTGFTAEPTAADDPYMIIYTSGTTGRPKGAVHVQAGFPIKAAHDLAYCFDLGPADTLFWLTDLGWMMGPWLIGGGLMLGAAIIMFEGVPDYPAPDRLWRLVERHRATVFGVAPTAIRALMGKDPAWTRGADLSSLRILGSTGETWNPDPWDWYFREIGGGRLPIINYSGGTETGGGLVGCDPLHPLKPCAFTGPVSGTIADVVDDAGQPLRGAVGELVVRQPWVGMTHGFWRDDERYRETYWNRFPGVWVHGDWAEIDADGFWFIRGRSDDTLKVAGKRVGPAEVESAAVAHPAVQEAAAIGAPHPIKGECAIVFAVLRPGADASADLAEEIRQTVAARLGAAMRPERVHLVADLPKTRNAKIMRRVIRAAYLGQSLGDMTALENPAAVDEIARAGAASRPD